MGTTPLVPSSPSVAATTPGSIGRTAYRRLPQFLLCGLLAPRESMSSVLEAVSSVLPMTFAYDALEQVSRGTGEAAASATTVVSFALLALGAGAATLRRRTA